MKAKKPDRSVSQMDVLKDIRGLLSTAKEQQGIGEARPEDKGSLRDETARLEAEVRRYQQLVQTQQEELDRLRGENRELAVRLNAAGPAKDRASSPRADKPGEEIAQLEARTAELSSALSQVEGLLQFKTRELLRRIARLYQEAGGSDIALEFRRGGDDLERADNLGRFVRALLEQ